MTLPHYLFREEEKESQKSFLCGHSNYKNEMLNTKNTLLKTSIKIKRAVHTRGQACSHTCFAIRVYSCTADVFGFAVTLCCAKKKIIIKTTITRRVLDYRTGDFYTLIACDKPKCSLSVITLLVQKNKIKIVDEILFRLFQAENRLCVIQSINKKKTQNSIYYITIWYIFFFC